MFYRPGRGEEVKLAFVRSFSRRSRKGEYYPSGLQEFRDRGQAPHPADRGPGRHQTQALR